MDLNTLDTKTVSDEGVAYTLRHPVTGEELVQDDGSPIQITLAGIDSDRFRKQSRANTERRLRTGTRRQITQEEMDVDGLDLLAACTMDWSGIVVDGQEPPCDMDHAKDLYKRFPWIREQVDTFIGARANFIRSSQTSSNNSPRESEPTLPPS